MNEYKCQNCFHSFILIQVEGFIDNTCTRDEFKR